MSDDFAIRTLRAYRDRLKRHVETMRRLRQLTREGSTGDDEPTDNCSHRHPGGADGDA